MNRRQEREEAFFMLFENEFAPDKDISEIYENAKEARKVEESAYVRTVLCGVRANKTELDRMIDRHSHGWKRERISAVAGAVMLLAAYEMLYMPEVPVRVSLNEAIELIKKYGEDKARPFVNGVLNAISEDEAVLAVRGDA